MVSERGVILACSKRGRSSSPVRRLDFKSSGVRQRSRAGSTPVIFRHSTLLRPAVGIVAMQYDKVLLIRHNRYLIEKVVWAIPSGGVDAGEAPDVAALRE